MSKILKLSYNGEAGYNTNIIQVKNFYRIILPVEEWLDTVDDFGISNRKKIFDGYTKQELFQYGLCDEDGNITGNEKDIIDSYKMPWPIQLHALAKDVPKDILINQSNFVISADARIGGAGGGVDFRVDLNSFYESQKQFGLIRDSDKFSREDWQPTSTDDSSYKDSVTKQKRNLKVWVWCKALMGDQGFNKNSVFDLTPFILSINTNTTEGGGSFSVSLAPILGKMLCLVDENGKKSPSGSWMPDKNSYVKTDRGDFVFKTPINDLSEVDSFSTNGDEPPFQENLYDGTVSVSRSFKNLYDNFSWHMRSEMFFTNLLSENDLIFISFRDDKEEVYEDDFFTSVDNIQKRNWDMIGLLDANGESLSPEATDISINVSGRDLMKLLIEDGSFFFQKSYANPDSEKSVFGNINLPNSGDGVNALNSVLDKTSLKGINRLITTGIIETLFIPQARNIGFLMNLLISRLSNIEICPSQVFESYGDRRTKFQVESDEYVNEEEKEETNETE